MRSKNISNTKKGRKIEMENESLAWAIEEFLQKKVKPCGTRKLNQARRCFDQTEIVTRPPYGLKQQEVLHAWLDQPVTGSKVNELAYALGQAIEFSIANYSRPKKTLICLYESFCHFLMETYGLDVPIDWDDYNIPDNREWKIIQMSTENKSIGEMAVELMVSERQIRNDLERLETDGLTFLDRKIPITGLKRKRGRIDFESTPHPILLLGNLMQVICLLEALRQYHSSTQSDIPKITAVQIWQNLSSYAKSVIIQRIKSGVYTSDLAWYYDLNLAVMQQDLFLTESMMVASNVSDQVLKCLKNSAVCSIRFRDEKGNIKILPTVIILRFLNRDVVVLHDIETGDELKLPFDQILSCE